MLLLNAKNYETITLGTYKDNIHQKAKYFVLDNMMIRITNNIEEPAD